MALWYPGNPKQGGGHNVRECNDQVGAGCRRGVWHSDFLGHVNYTIALFYYFNQSFRFGVLDNAQMIGLLIRHRQLQLK